MKIAVIGYSGSGKSTLSKILGEKFNAPVLYIDKVHWLSGWKENDAQSKEKAVLDFLDNNSSWVIDGNYHRLFWDRRMKEADKIIFMNFNRFSCFARVVKRVAENKGKTRESMTDGCNEKLDAEFASWILFKSRGRHYKQKFRKTISENKEKVITVKTQKQLDRLIANLDALAE